MGTHISFVRSCEMDKFVPEMLHRIEVGGNGRARAFFKLHGLLDGKHVDYHSKLALKYKSQLDKEVSKTSSTADKEKNDVVKENIASPSSNTSTLSPLLTIENSPPMVPVQTVPTVQTVHSIKSGLRDEGSPRLLSVKLLPSKAGLNARKIDNDFDFDEFEKEVSLGVSVTKAPVVPRRSAGTNAEANQVFVSDRRFTCAKSISSADYFSTQDVSPHEKYAIDTKMAKFKDSSAISSDAFFSNGANGSKTMYEDSATQQVQHMTEQARQRFSSMASNAQHTVDKAREWFSSLGL